MPSSLKFLLYPCLGLLFLIGMHSEASGQEKWHTVQGSELKTLFTNQELADNVHYAYRLRSDGKITGVEMGKNMQGTWKTTAHDVCWTWVVPAYGEDCYEVRQKGHEVRLSQNGDQELHVTITPIRKNFVQDSK